ncbi:MAG: hypothetical protein Q4A32_00145 [Lachnospiraceae bacterium]|nr:hypothetical protein [Lachnospiraceae bacterium]
MKKAGKGEYGYFRSERRKRSVVFVLMLAIPAIFMIIGILLNGTVRNLLTVVACVSLIPCAMSLVSVIMVFLHDSLPEEEYREISAHAGSLLMAFELYVTHEKASTYVDACAICGNNVVGYVSDQKANISFTQEYITKTLRQNGYSVSVNLMSSQDKFIERLDSLNEHAASLREGIADKPDSRYPDYNREEVIWMILTEISL